MTQNTFQDLGLDEKILKAVVESGYTTPTEIQAKAIPSILMMRDVVGIAQTGTGKTASFTLPMIEILQGGVAKARMPRSLVLAPTRELAAQVADNIEKYGKYLNLSHALIVGGVNAGDQISKLERGVDILIATPGRLLDLFERGNVLLRDIKFLVIDEADRMLDMGFIPDIEKILALLPPMRQTLLFSATMPKPVQKLAEKFMSNPKTVEVAPQSSAATTVTQKLLVLAKTTQKKDALINLIKNEKVTSAFVFCNRKRDIDGYATALQKEGINAGALHGDMAQTKRTETLAKFKANEIPILICSDVAARGIDISGVGHVFNMDLPMNAEDYIHRIGRTGRAGKSGAAFSFACLPADEKFLAAIEKMLGKPIERMTLSGKTPAAKETAPREKSESKRPARVEKTASKPSEMQKSKPKPRCNQDETSSFEGFGDDVPAFMKIGR